MRLSPMALAGERTGSVARPGVVRFEERMTVYKANFAEPLRAPDLGWHPLVHRAFLNEVLCDSRGAKRARHEADTDTQAR